MIIGETDQYVIEHYGKAGMKWGVRQRGRIARNVTVGKGGGSKLDKARVHLMANPLSVIKNKGFKKAAAAKGQRMLGRQERVSQGKTKVKDILPLIGSHRANDVFPSVRSKVITKDQKSNVAKLTKGKQVGLVVLGVVGTIAVSSLANRAGNAAVRQLQKTATGGL